MQTIHPYILIGFAGTGRVSVVPFIATRIATGIIVVIRPERALLLLPVALPLFLPLLLPSLA